MAVLVWHISNCDGGIPVLFLPVSCRMAPLLVTTAAMIPVA